MKGIKKWRNPILTMFIMSIFLVSNYVGIFNPFPNKIVNENDLNGRLNTLDMPYNPIYSNYTYINNVNETLYLFNAMGTCYILAEVANIDYTSFEFDNHIYNVSYGLNIFPVDLGDTYRLHNFSIPQPVIDNNYLDWLALESLYLEQGNLTVNLTEASIVNFSGAGPVSVLVQPDFAYNWLYLEVDDILLNDIYTTSIYPEIDSAFYSYFFEGGSYIRFDLNLEPDLHVMKLKGNGSLNYKIMVNHDWDKDEIPDVKEVQQHSMNALLDPTYPNIWGFFEKGSEQSYLPNMTGTESGLFCFYIPFAYSGSRYLYICTESGIISNIIVDKDSITLKDIVLWDKKYSELWDDTRNTPYGTLDPGYHLISYDFCPNMSTKISFKIDGRDVINLDLAEFKDIDADGVKDGQEHRNGLNSQNSDTDQDGLPDSMDPSPLAALTLDKNRLKQIIIPTNPNNNTVVNIFIKKPDPDYTTYNNREWRPANESGEVLEVVIQPILRLFGNPSTTRSQLTSKFLLPGTVDSFSLVPGYATTGLGDAIPYQNDPNAEFMFVHPKESEATIEFDIAFGKGHPAKSDSIIDLRFDVGWLVTYLNASNKMRILHFYHFENDMVLQAIVARDLGNVNYILASPDSFIENQILWALTQNPSLGTPTDFFVADDIVGMGTVDYYELANKTTLDRKNSPLLPDETEVLYVAGLQDNMDILNKIILQTVSNPSFEMRHVGNCSLYFSSYSISDVYQNANYTFDDDEINGEDRVCFILGWNNYNNGGGISHEQEINYLGFPIDMNVSIIGNSRILSIINAIGSGVPLSNATLLIKPNLHEKISFWNRTFIEPISGGNGIPRLNYNESIHLVKEFINKRQTIEKSELIFEFGSTPLAELIYNTFTEIENTLLIFNQITNQIPEFPAYFDEDFIERLVQTDSSSDKILMLNKLEHAIQNYPLHDTLETLIQLEIDIELSVEITILSETMESFKILDSDMSLEDVIDTIFDFVDDDDSFISQRLKSSRIFQGLRVGYGFFNIIKSSSDFVFGLVECYSLIKAYYEGTSEYSTIEFVGRLTLSVGYTTLSLLAAFEAVVAVTKILHGSLPSVLVKVAKWAPKVIRSLTIFIVVIESTFKIVDAYNNLLDTYNKYGFGVEYTTQLMTSIIEIGLFDIAPAVLITFGGPVGVVVGVILYVIGFIWDWLFGTNQEPKTEVVTYDPDIAISDNHDLTYLSIDEQTVYARGSMEVGDPVGLTMTFTNYGDGDGDCTCRYEARMGLLRHDNTINWGNWKYGDLTIGASQTQTWTRTTTEVGIGLIMIIDLKFYCYPGTSTKYLIFETTDRIPLNTPVLPTDITSFFANTAEILKLDHEMMRDSYQRAMDDYQYKDAADILNILRRRLTYDFLEEPAGTLPVNWTDNSGSVNCDAMIQNTKAGHSKVLKLDDQASDGCVQVIQHFGVYPFVLFDGSVEFWLYKENPTDCDFNVIFNGFFESDNFVITFGNDSHIYYDTYVPIWTPDYWFDYKKDYNKLIGCYRFVDKTWYHIRIDIAQANVEGQYGAVFYLWINGIKISNRIPIILFQPHGDYFDIMSFEEIRFQTGNFYPFGDTGTFFIDGIDYSWSSGYYSGRSLYAWNYTLQEINNFEFNYQNMSTRVNFDKDLVNRNFNVGDGSRRINFRYIDYESYNGEEIPNEEVLWVNINISFPFTIGHIGLDDEGIIRYAYDFNWWLGDDWWVPIRFYVDYTGDKPLERVYFFQFDIRIVATGELIFSAVIPFSYKFINQLHYTQLNEIWSYDEVSIVWGAGEWTANPIHPICFNSINTTDLVNTSYWDPQTKQISTTIGEILQIQCMTNSTKEITLQLFNDSQQVKNFTLIPRGNRNFRVQFVELFIDENIIFNKFTIKADFSNQEYIKLYNPTIIDATVSPLEYTPINSFDFLNLGTVPMFLEFEFSGVPWNSVDHSFFPDEFYLKKQLITILPGEKRDFRFNISNPLESISNLVSRSILVRDAITKTVIAKYTDNFQVSGIYINIPKNQTYNIYNRETYRGIPLSIIPQEDLDWTAYSLDGQALVNFSDNAVIPLPQDGSHTLQVFGRTQNNTQLESEVRYFSIKSHPMEFINFIEKLYWPTESIVLTFTTPCSLNSFFYSIDGQIPVSIPGNTSIIYPIHGDHFIQVLGVDLDGVIYETVSKSFAVFSTNVPTSPGSNISLYEPYLDLQFNFTQIHEAGNLTISYLNSHPNYYYTATGNYLFQAPWITYVFQTPDSIASIILQYLTYYEVSASFSFTGKIELNLPYDEEQVIVDEIHLKLYRYTSSLGWIEITTYIDTVNNRIYGETTSLGTFVILEARDETSPKTYWFFEGTPSPYLSFEFISPIKVTLVVDDQSKLVDTFYSINDGDWNTYMGPFYIYEEGSVILKYYSKDVAGNQAGITTVETYKDTIPPITSIHLSSYDVKPTDGSISVTTNTKFTIICNEEERAIYYRINNGNFIEYDGPFILEGELGVYTISFYGIDLTGWVETQINNLTITLGNPSSFQSESFYNRMIWGESYTYLPQSYNIEEIGLDSFDNIIFVANTYSYTKVLLTKCDNTGSKIWEVTWDGAENEACEALVLDAADNIFLAGYTESFGSSGWDLFLVKYDSSGNLQWQKLWDTGYDEGAYDMVTDSEGNFYVAGQIDYPDYSYAILVKFDNAGNLIWNRTFSLGWRAAAITIDSLNNLYVGVQSHNGLYLVKYSSSGNLLWYKNWNHTSSWTWVEGIDLDSKGNLYVSIMIGYQFFATNRFLKFDATGNLCWVRDDIPSYADLKIDASDNIYAVGWWDISKYDTQGNQKWKFSPMCQTVYASTIDTDGNFYFGGDWRFTSYSSCTNYTTVARPYITKYTFQRPKVFPSFEGIYVIVAIGLLYISFKLKDKAKSPNKKIIKLLLNLNSWL